MVGSQNERTKREARVAGPMNCVAVPEVARQEAMFPTRCGKSVRREVHGSPLFSVESFPCPGRRTHSRGERGVWTFSGRVLF